MDSVGADQDMLVDDYEGEVDKPDVAVIHPDDSQEENESEPLADDCDAMKTRFLPKLSDLEISDESISTWNIADYRALKQKERGPIFECGGHPWRILLFPFGNSVDFASLYLEQGRDQADSAHSSSENWSACVQFTLVLWNQHDPSIFLHHTANHRFSSDESDWGFTRFIELRKLFATSWEDKGRPLVENDCVNVTAYVRTYVDSTGVLWHNFLNYNSKKETGMVGLKNQGATCYLNSLLQSLYFTNAFRKAIYQIPTENENDKSKSAWALQRLFYLLQTSSDAVSTQELTQSFGWETQHIFAQQDVQELSRILMERMEERMKGTQAENALAKMFVGKMKTYISCIDVDYESSRVEDFWDIQLNVSGNKNLDDSFKDYIQVETMDGENKYYAEGHGLQDAKKGVIFESFPQVLHLQLKRFEYDLNRDAMMKVNDRYEFPEIFDASPYLSATADKSEPDMYSLHSVLVHSGDFNAGHYYAFLRPTAEGHFYKFDDDRVTRATMKEALDENFGGDYAYKANGMAVRNPYTHTLSTKRSMSAYMLVYIRQSRRDSILQELTEREAPPHLAKQLQGERDVLEKKRKEKEEQHLYLSLYVVTEASFKAHQGFDLTNWDPDDDSPSKPQYHRVLKASTVKDFEMKMAESMKLPPEHVRLWVMVNRQNKTVRPDQPLEDPDMTMEAAYAKHASRDRSLRLWVEQASVLADGKPVWPDSQENQAADPSILVLLKHFDVAAQTLRGVGHLYLKKQSKVEDMFSLITSLMGWDTLNDELANGLENGQPDSDGLALYEEIKSSMIEAMKPKSTLQQSELQDGDIVCFQRHMNEQQTSAIASAGGFTDAREFYDHLLNRKQVAFSPKNLTSPDKEVFKLDLSRKMSYDQFSAKVGEYLKADSTHIRFFTINLATGKPKGVVRRIPNQTLNQILNPAFGTYGNSNQRDDALFYETLDMSLSELDTKRSFKVTYVTEGQSKEETFEILAPKLGNVNDLVVGLAKKANTDRDISDHLRLYEVHQGRFHREYKPEASLNTIAEYSTLIAETMPEEERDMQEGDCVIFCFHFDKEPMRAHGIPFKFVVKPAETFKDTKARLSKRTGLKGKYFERVKFAVVPRSIYAKPHYLEDGDVLFELARSTDDALGLDHVNRKQAVSSKNDSIFIR